MDITAWARYWWTSTFRVRTTSLDLVDTVNNAAMTVEGDESANIQFSRLDTDYVPFGTYHPPRSVIEEFGT